MDDTNDENPQRSQAPTQPALPAAAPPYYPPPLPAPVPAAKGLRVPLVALALSFLFPGAGQMYNGQLSKAFFVFCAFVGSIYATAEAGFVFFFCIFFVYFFNLIDAYRTAVLSNERAAGGVRVEEPLDAESPLWGALLIAFGILILLNNLGLVRLSSVGRFWPLALVVAGVMFIYQSSQRKKDPPKGGSDAFLS